jgi:hypothetical protein
VKLVRAYRFLHLGQRYDLGVPGYILFAGRVIDGLCDNFTVDGDDGAKRVFAFIDCHARELDAAFHHRLIRREAY